MFSRRDLLKYSGQAALAGSLPATSTFLTSSMTKGPKAIRCINIVNFIRAVEPRFKIDLLLPVQKQMELILEHQLPATWLLQYDALVSGPFVKYLKEHMAKNHEVGFWFEMNEMHCKDAGVEWRGRPGFEWDHFPPVAFTIGYTLEERIKLADTAMKRFKEIWGKNPKSIASWNLDSFTIAHLTKHYGIDAFAVCRDQIATDGFTIWGAPIAGYYPSKTNCWSPALDKKNQIDAPIFRMLGQDPVYYYNREYHLPDGKRITEPDTMEPVWTSGRSPRFVDGFLKMIAEAPTQQFAYAQMGQENSFPWPDQQAAYAPQLQALVKQAADKSLIVETMGDSGRRFKKAFSTTPTQAQVQLEDPFGNTPPQGSIWYQSRFYRANLHLQGDLPFLRDLTVYSDQNPQPFLEKATRLNDVEQRMPSVLDGYHWKKDSLAGGMFMVNGARLRTNGKPEIREEGKSLIVDLPIVGGATLHIQFDEKSFSVSLSTKDTLVLSFEWDPTKAALIEVQPDKAAFKASGFEYSVGVKDGIAQLKATGWSIKSEKGSMTLLMAQPS